MLKNKFNFPIASNLGMRYNIRRQEEMRFMNDTINQVKVDNGTECN